MEIPNAAFLEKHREEKGKNYLRAEMYKFFERESILENNK